MWARDLSDFLLQNNVFLFIRSSDEHVLKKILKRWRNCRVK
ncbi:MAG: hypothetical protein ACUVQM_00240 [Candidatus Hadarchaeaceae archaeon]